MISKLLLISILLILAGCSLTPQEEISAPITETVITPPVIQVETSGDMISRYAIVDEEKIIADTRFVMSRPVIIDNTSRQTTLTTSDSNIIIIDQNCIHSSDSNNPYIKCDGSVLSDYLAGQMQIPELDPYRDAFLVQLQDK